MPEAAAAAEAAIPVVVNREGGTAARLGGDLAPTLTAAFAKGGVAIGLHLVAADEVAGVAERFAGAPVVVIGGGDGTLGAAAGVLAGRSAMAILPLGTRNHLARDLGIPLDLDGAAALIGERPLRRIDLGRVGSAGAERPFVNNASIGLYPAVVRRRDEGSAPKWLAAIPAAAAALARLRHHRLRLSLDDRERPVATPLLFVGNNRYALDGRAIGTRGALDAGHLSVYAVASHRRLALLGLALRLLAGRSDLDRDFAAIGTPRRLTARGHARHLDVALDGEVHRLALPLEFRSDAGALTVVAPPGGA